MAKFISIHSFRGGTGKSNLTANLAAVAALRGKRVGIVDTDIQSPGIHVLFGLDDQSMVHTLNQFLHGQCEIEQVAYAVGEANQQLAGLKMLAKASIWLVPSSINGDEISKILKEGYEVRTLNKGLSRIAKAFNLDYLFIDTHPGLNQETLLSIAISDVLVIVVRPDQQDLQGTSVTVDVARSLDVPHMFVALNKVPHKFDFAQVRQEVQKKFGVPVGAVLPLSEEMVELGSADLFSLLFPNHPWSLALRELADVVLV
jgi:MinD-like ATPase involved in chromosome partitioning or flagellar assembly